MIKLMIMFTWSLWNNEEVETLIKNKQYFGGQR